MIELMDHQVEAVTNLGNGKILWGGVGSGKSATVIAYYVANETPRDIIVITPAKKRNTMDWETEAVHYGISTEREHTRYGTITVDSWNNVAKYEGCEDAFFIFDEQRVVGTGSWVRSFIKIAKKNHWVLLSATPGDTWLDYAPVFVANGYYKNITEFKREHVLYEPFSKYPKVKGYIGERKLAYLRNEVLVEMPYIRNTVRNLNYMDVSYDELLYKKITRDRWNIYEDRPLKDVSEMFRVMRRLVNSDPSRFEMVQALMKVHPRLIIFYNFNYELEILRQLDGAIDVFEYNGTRHDPVPDGDRWVYLVQYMAGSEGWNCVATDAMIMYSLTYSYKNYMQAQGRIDRLNTKFDVLYYYILASNSKIDRSVLESLSQKRNFNERKWLREVENWGGSEEVISNDFGM
jgi:hypothetical protein